MSTQALQEFRGKVNGSEQLQAAVLACQRDLDALARLGQQHGYDITRDDISATFADTSGELSDLELELVSAGIPSDNGSPGTHT